MLGTIIPSLTRMPEERAKRKKREAPVWKLRQWSPRLRCIVALAVLHAVQVGSIVARRNERVDSTVKENDVVTSHPLYFALQDLRPAAITSKLDDRAVDAYDVAAHANPAATQRNYDRRRVKFASATE